MSCHRIILVSLGHSNARMQRSCLSYLPSATVLIVLVGVSASSNYRSIMTPRSSQVRIQLRNSWLVHFLAGNAAGTTEQPHHSESIAAQQVLHGLRDGLEFIINVTSNTRL